MFDYLGLYYGMLPRTYESNNVKVNINRSKGAKEFKRKKKRRKISEKSRKINRRRGKYER